MNFWDIALLILVAAALIAALVHVLRRRGSCVCGSGCSGCTGECAQCARTRAGKGCGKSV